MKHYPEPFRRGFLTIALIPFLLTGCASYLAKMHPLAAPQPPLVLKEPQMGHFCQSSGQYLLFPKGDYAAAGEDPDYILYQAPDHIRALVWYKKVPVEDMKNVEAARAEGKRVKLSNGQSLNATDVRKVETCERVGAFLVNAKSGIPKIGGIMLPKATGKDKRPRVWWFDRSVGQGKYVFFDICDLEL